MDNRNDIPQLSAQEVIDYYEREHKFILSDEAKQNLQTTFEALPAYTASVTIFGLLIGLKVTSTFNDLPYTFSGSAFGLGTVEIGYSLGVIYTNDVPKLVSNTESIMILAAAQWLTVVFYDSNHKPLGNFQGFVIGISGGIFGGKGSWGG